MPAAPFPHRIARMSDPVPAPPPPAGFRHWFKRFGTAAILAAGGVALPSAGALLLGTLTVTGTMKEMALWLRQHGALGAAVSVLAYWPLGGLAFVPSWAFSGLAGWTFGAWPGSCLALVGLTGASILGYLLARLVARDQLMQELRRHPKWDAVAQAMLGRGFWRTTGIITLIRIPSSSPFALTNFMLACVNAPLGPYLLGTAVGLLPRSAAVAIVFAGASEFRFEEPGGYFGLVITAIMAIVIIAILGRIAQSALRNVASVESSVKT
jgi:uncharacterized membrane protein YdjX (TVP38/TMEM64 family)